MQHEHAHATVASSTSVWDFFARILDTDFMQRGECVSWRPEIVWLHVAADASIALAYYSIPIALIYYIRRRPNQAFNWMFLMFALFILACGTTHVMSILAFWFPLYRLDGVIKVATGLLSITTAVTLWPLIPKALAVPTPTAYRAANAALKKSRDELELRVTERTAELTATNARLQSEIDRRTQVQDSLRRSEERFRVALASTPISVFNQDRELRYTWFNGPPTGMKEADALGKTDEDLFDPPTAARLHEIKSQVLFDGVGRHAEVTITGGPEPRFVEFRAEPLKDDQGEVVGITGAKIDITERKRAEQHKAFLLAELDHRVKNNLSVVLALAEESVQNSASMDEFGPAFVGRVRALAKTHAALAASRWEGVRLDGLLNLILETYTIGAAVDKPPRARISGSSIQLSPKAASSLCMTFNELVTNAAKYGAFSTSDGHVTITWITLQALGREPTLQITWAETDGPPVSPPARRGLGSQLIEEGIAYELGGVVRTEYRPTGVVCIIEFPLNPQNTRRGRYELLSSHDSGETTA